MGGGGAPSAKLGLLPALASLPFALGAGNANCPCVDKFPSAWAARWVNASCQVIRGDHLTGEDDDKRDFCYATDYGLGKCSDWDKGLEPKCTGANPPEWCSQKWCYVNSSACTLNDATVSTRTVTGGRTVDMPHYSYVTCGFESAFAKYQRAALQDAKTIIRTVEGYLTDMRNFLERQIDNLRNDEASGSCPGWTDSCSCPDCKTGAGGWRAGSGETGYDVDFNGVTVTHRDGNARSGKTAEEISAQCLALLFQSKLKQIARLEYNDPNRMGFLAYADQASAVYSCWPGIKWCPSSYDARFRPWYVSAVSGPKDIVIVMDQSGSMRSEGRWTKAQEAAAAVLGTLTEFDRANIVMFGSTAKTYDGTTKLQAVTQANLKLMEDWVNSEQPVGSTNFRDGFDKAFKLFKGGESTNCNKAILFMTDGVDTSGLQTSELAGMMGGMDVTIFTYSFGNGADRQRPKEIACAHKGIWYHVDDGADIATVMSGYYLYYAGPLANSKKIRWTEFQEFTTKNDLIEGSVAVFDRNEEPPRLKGVVAFDVSIIMSVPTFRSKSDYAEAMSTLRKEAAECTLVSLSNGELEPLRKSVAYESQCSVSVTSGATVHSLPRLLLAAAAVAATLRC